MNICEKKHILHGKKYAPRVKICTAGNIRWLIRYISRGGKSQIYSLRGISIPEPGCYVTILRASNCLYMNV